jgi:hypothetical protein
MYVYKIEVVIIELRFETSLTLTSSRQTYVPLNNTAFYIGGIEKKPQRAYGHIYENFPIGKNDFLQEAICSILLGNNI